MRKHTNIVVLVGVDGSFTVTHDADFNGNTFNGKDNVSFDTLEELLAYLTQELASDTGRK